MNMMCHRPRKLKAFGIDEKDFCSVMENSHVAITLELLMAIVAPSFYTRQRQRQREIVRERGK